MEKICAKQVKIRNRAIINFVIIHLMYLWTVGKLISIHIDGLHVNKR